jgi:RNA polymerase sigma factor (sigma-70 family)
MSWVGTGALAERLRAGDRAAFAEIYSQFAEPVLGLCIVLLRDRDDAADAMHDAFILAAQRIDQLRDPERLRPWLFAIARHVCFRRIVQRRRTTPVATVPDIDLTDDDPTDGLAATEAAELVWAAASGLNDRDRAVLYLNMSQGLEGAALTAALGVQHANPHSLISRAKRQLDRAIGVLLVARSGRLDCASLDGILKDWNGTLSPLDRKRVGRHVDHCEICRPTRVRAIAASIIGTIAALAAQTAQAMPAVFNADDLYDIAARRPLSTERWQRDGFPPPADERSRRRRLLIFAVLLLALIAGFVLLRDSDPRAVRRPSPRQLQPAASVSPAPTSATRDARTPATTSRRPKRQAGVPTAHTPPAATISASAETLGAGSLTAPSMPPLQPEAPRPASTTPASTTPVTARPTPVTVKRIAPTTTAPRPTTTTAAPPTTTTTTPPSA